VNKLQQIVDWTVTARMEDRTASDFSSDLDHVRSESELSAELTKRWAHRKAQVLKLDSSGARNRLATENTTEAPRPDTQENFASPKIRLGALRKLQATFSALQEWEGYVVDVTASHVIANLVDLTNAGERPDEHAEIPLSEFSESDIETLAPGKVFRWAIGYHRLPTGTKVRGSQFVFRELPQWTDQELKDAKEEASELAEFFNHQE
jgi:hypothetical protein